MPFPRPTAGDRKRPPRRALVLLETIVAAFLVLTLMSVAVPLFIHSARIWKQTRHQQFACDELSGQMDRLVGMTVEERSHAIEELVVSPEIQAVLYNASLSGELIDDVDGKRIELGIDWQRTGDPEPITLTAWIDASPDQPIQKSDDPDDDDSTNEELDSGEPSGDVEKGDNQ